MPHIYYWSTRVILCTHLQPFSPGLVLRWPGRRMIFKHDNRKNFQFVTVCNGDTAIHHTHKTAKIKKVILLLQQIAIMSTCFKSNSTFLIFAVWVVSCTPCCRYRLFITGRFWTIYICCFVTFMIYYFFWFRVDVSFLTHALELKIGETSSTWMQFAHVLVTFWCFMNWSNSKYH